MTKLVTLFIAGIGISLLLNRNISATGSIFVSNMLFVTSMCFIIIGLMQFVSNVGLFNGVAFGTRSLIRLIKSGLKGSEREKEAYLQYIESRKKSRDVAKLLIIGAGLMLVSVLVSFV